MGAQAQERLDEEELELASDPYGSEYASVHAEELAGAAISLHLPEERTRIREALATFPPARETKVDKLLSGLGVLLRQNPQEKVVVFATYLGTVDLISKLSTPGQKCIGWPEQKYIDKESSHQTSSISLPFFFANPVGGERLARVCKAQACESLPRFPVFATKKNPQAVYAPEVSQFVAST